MQFGGILFKVLEEKVEQCEIREDCITLRQTRARLLKIVKYEIHMQAFYCITALPY